MSSARLFHSIGAVTEKTRSPHDFILYLDIIKSFLFEERNDLVVWYGIQNSFK